MQLTKRQEAFAQHYALHGNATEAYKAAGYSWKRMKNNTLSVEAAKLAARPKVSLRIAELKAHVAYRAEHIFNITADRILQELAAIGFANMQDYIRVDLDGQPILDFSSLQRHQWAAVGEVTIEDIETGQRTGKRSKFKLLDKKGALVELGKYVGLFEKDNAQRVPNINIIEAPAISDADTDTDALRKFEDFRQRATAGHAAGHA